MKRLSTFEFKRRVFNEAITEGLCQIHGSILNGDSSDDNKTSTMADKLCREFFKQTLNLNNSTVSTTKANLAESITYIKDLVNICESIATDKAATATDEDLDIPEDQPVELSAEDKNLLNTLFDNKTPQLQIDKVRDDTVKALLAEDKKAEEIKNSIDIAKSTVDNQKTDGKTLEETINRLNGVGPTSLMNAIMNSVAVSAVKDVSSQGNFKNVKSVMKENADSIKTRSVMIYSLYEMASTFGIVKYKPADVQKICNDIYYAK